MPLVFGLLIRISIILVIPVETGIHPLPGAPVDSRLRGVTRESACALSYEYHISVVPVETEIHPLPGPLVDSRLRGSDKRECLCSFV